MDINITIFFQAIQFFIAYFFLYRFLFAPVYDILREQEFYEKKLHENLEKKHNIKDSLQKTFMQRQIALKTLLINMIPDDIFKLIHQKSNKDVILYRVEKNENSSTSLDDMENFLIDNLSQVIK